MAEPQLNTSEINKVIDVLKSGLLSEGKINRELEQKFAEFAGSKHAVTVVNGTAALHVSLEAAGFSPGDEIITSAFTFIASANSIAMIGAVPVFADIDPRTWTLNLKIFRSLSTQVHTGKTSSLSWAKTTGRP